MYDHNCTLCPLHETAKTVCMAASGEATWPGMIIGEAPGANEDERGEPFIGRSGRILDRALAEASGLSSKVARSRLIVTNAVKCRPPNNRNPTAEELDACVTYLEKEIKVYDPMAILALGNVATISLLGQGGISKMREEEHYLNRDVVTRVFVTFHPSFISRQGYGSDAAQMFKDDVAQFVSLIRKAAR